MWIELFLCLLLAHLVADFVLQTSASCKSKADLCIDVWKSYRAEDVVWFSLDQLLHLLVLAGVAWIWISLCEWRNPFGVEAWWIAVAVAVLICWKPSNFFIKLMLRHFSVNMPEEKESGFNAGALIGTIERWLILIFVCLQRYDALGLLIAAKSIIRFGDSQMNKSEYVLAGTLLSIFIAVLVGLGVMMAHKI